MRHDLSAATVLAALFIAASPVAAQTLPTSALPTSALTADDTAKMAALGKPYGAWGFDTAGMDTSVKPGDDFLTYADGKALTALTIPADLPSYGVWDKLADLSELRVKALILDIAAQKDATGDEAKIGAMYRSAMDNATRNARDIAPVVPELRAVSAITTKSAMAAYMGKTTGTFGRGVFNPGVNDDPGHPGFEVLSVRQGGLGLPDRDYYLKDAYADKLKAYEAYVTDLLRLAGYADAAGHAHAIVAMETQIATVSWARKDRRDPTKIYNPMALKDFAALTPGFDTSGFLRGAGVTHASKIVVGEKSAFPLIAKVFADTPLETLKAWETFHVLDQAAPYLSDRFRRRAFDFHEKTLTGIEEQRPDWKLAVTDVDATLGQAVGRAYAAQYFPPESKAKMEALVSDLLTAMKARIDTVAWMSPDTRARAQEKLAKFGVRIGYPNRWKDYSALTITEDDLYGNMVRSGVFEWQRALAKIDKPIDPEDWGMTPQTVNAYYSPNRNEIVFPAAILQSPFFDPHADMAVNYGAIGAVIGHEITHGFDDQGRHFDGTGALKDWWTVDDATKFEARTKALGAQFDAYEPLPGQHVQGALTMGENIADLGGNLMALDAYHLSLKGQPAPVIDGFSGDQRFFLGWAQSWGSKYRDDYLKQALAVDPHSPDMIRALAPERNIDAWYAAFGVTDGKYYVKPDDRVRIW